MNSFIETTNLVRDAIVAIGNPTEDADGKPTLNVWGTGFCVSPRGLVITCAHVVETYLRAYQSDLPERMREVEGQTIQCNAMKPCMYYFFFDSTKEKWSALMVDGLDIVSYEKEDIAIITPQAESFRAGVSDYPFLQLDTSSQLEGQEVGIGGFPLGDTLMLSMKSATRSFHYGHIGAVLPYPGAKTVSRYQLDVFANPGNSGGPVFRREDGKVVGMVNMTIRDANNNFAPTGISFAVPATKLLTEIENWENGGKGILARQRLEGQRLA